MTSEGRANYDEELTGSECSASVHLPRRVVEQMTEMLTMFLMTASLLVQPSSKSETQHVRQTFENLYSPHEGPYVSGLQSFMSIPRY